MIGKFLGAFLGALLTPPAMFAAILSGGAGHGDYVWARILYPFPVLAMALPGSMKETVIVALAAVQFPIYGFLLGSALQKPRKPWIGIFTVCVHALLVAWVFISPP